jgi:hypothetical protein
VKVRTFDLTNDSQRVEGEIVPDQRWGPVVKVQLPDGRVVIRKRDGLTPMDKEAEAWLKGVEK